ncbi:UPF0389 protein CG9231 isoform X1 [Frieseomelitta varia]|uniref:UPF0389 protein CG9231 isoform X1 n=1 Tax=Frieseomelitta varia TaxID=561572 RepID=UPI001CB6B2DB|nr:UPF0389 protein CG9231 isoform X1 [Frieseomelitta varia]
MFCIRLTRQFKLSRVRQLHSTVNVKNENKVVSETSKTAETSQSTVNKEKVDFVTEYIKKFCLGPPMHAVSSMDKRILVWVKRFPSIDQVPDYVSYQCIQHAHTKARIRVCFIMFFLGIVICVAAVVAGKREAASGKSIATERVKWYMEIKKKAEEEKKNAENVQ